MIKAVIVNSFIYSAEIGMWLHADHKLSISHINPSVLTVEISRGIQLSRSARDTAQVIHDTNMKYFFKQNGKVYPSQHKSIHPAVKAKAHIIPMSLDDI
jgi:hypothetical protein